MRIAGLILAAGFGTRMGQLLEERPKPLLTLGGKALLLLAIDKLTSAGVEAIFINLYYKADQISAFLSAASSTVPIVTRTENRLSGPAGALRLFADTLDTFDLVLVTSCDVLLSASLSELVYCYTHTPVAMVFGCTQSTHASRYGILSLNEMDDVISCREKPQVPDDEVHLISAGVYCIEPRAIAYLPTHQNVDFARDLAPTLLINDVRVRACRLKGYWRDVGTPESYMQALVDLEFGKFQVFNKENE